jgi:hypothetical protein
MTNLKTEVTQRGVGPPSGWRQLPLIPPNYFGIAFGLAGLAEVWTLAAPTLGVSVIVGRAFALVATAAWLILMVIHMRFLLWLRSRFGAHANA